MFLDGLLVIFIAGSKFLDVSKSFGRKKKGSDSEPMSPQMLGNVHAVKSVHPAELKSPRSHFTRKQMDDGSFSSSEQNSRESNSKDRALNGEQVHHSGQLVPLSGRIAVTALLGLDDDHEPEAISRTIKVSSACSPLILMCAIIIHSTLSFFSSFNTTLSYSLQEKHQQR